MSSAAQQRPVRHLRSCARSAGHEPSAGKHVRLGLRYASAALLGLLIMCLGSRHTTAQTFPQRGVKIIVPYPPSGVTDILARVVGPGLQAMWNVPVVIENRAGASGNIGMDAVAKAQPDGLTLAMANSTVAINDRLVQKPFDIEKDFEPLGILATTPMVLAVNASISARTLSELTSVARSNPNGVIYGSCGVGTPQHLAIELYQSMAQVKMLHVPYRGCAPAVTDAISGQIHALAFTTAQIMPQIEAGRMRALAITSARRSVFAPDVPTFQEAGLAGYDLDIWVGLMAPAATPESVLQQIHRDVAAVLSTTQSAAPLAAAGMELNITSRMQHRDVLRADLERYAQMLAKLDLKGFQK